MQFYQYDGSLTTPGCDEVVTHIVLAEPFVISQAQLDSYKNQYKNNADWGLGNYRSIQKLEGRTILKGDVINDSVLPHYDFKQRAEEKYIAALFVVLFILVVVLFILVAIALMKAMKSGGDNAKNYGQVKTDQNVN